MAGMVAFAESSRNERQARTSPRAGSPSCEDRQKPKTRFHRNQQYSITALTDGTGSIVERYAYNAYGQPAFLDASGTVLTSSAEDNRYTYTGREWDEVLGLYHFRARMYDATEGRFASRDPSGHRDGASLYRNYFVVDGLDPSGLVRRTYNIYDMVYEDPRRINKIIAEVDVWAHVVESNCKEICRGQCTGTLVLEVGFRWRGLEKNGMHVRPGGLLCDPDGPHGKECSELSQNDDRNGMNGLHRVTIPCGGKEASGVVYVNSTTESWDYINEVTLQNLIDSGMTRQEALELINKRAGLFGIKYEIGFGTCGIVLSENLEMEVNNPGEWVDPSSPMIWPKELDPPYIPTPLLVEPLR